ncbi:MAG TPA: chloride channel protein [Acidimicrobiales bacterium]|nr:chloride channel protein [Acidimicrobiales bacterium]
MDGLPDEPDHDRHLSAVAPGRRLLMLVVLVGLGSGVIGALFVGSMHALQAVLWPTHWDLAPHLALMVGVGLAVGLLTRFLGSPGDVELLVDNIHVMGGRDDIRDLRSLIPVSLLCIAVGGAMGPEAPLVQTGGSFGSWIAHRWNVDRDELRILTITGMAAAFTVLFGAPLGSAIFALEILHRRGLEYYEALLPAILGSLAGFAVYVALTGVGFQPVWHFPAPAALRVVDLGWAVVCGVIGAALAASFTYLSVATRWLFRRVPPGVRPIAGGLSLGLLAIWSPYALTFGEAQIDPLLARRALVLVFVTAILAKLIGTSVTLSSGWRGGFIIPLFFIGVAAGRLLHLLVPSTNEIVVVAALMSATNVGVTKTPIGSTVVVSEMAGLRLLPTTLIASVVSLFLTSEVGLIHTQRDREGAFDRSSDRAAVSPVAAATADGTVDAPVVQPTDEKPGEEGAA